MPLCGDPALMAYRGAEEVHANILRGLQPKKSLTVSQWADRRRFLSAKHAKQSGRWKTATVPFMREIMDVLSDRSPVQSVALQKGAQLAGTEVANNWVGYRESLVDMNVIANATVSLDPNRVTVYRLRAEGTLTLDLVDPIPPDDLGEDAETPLYVTSLVVRISRPAGAGIVFPAGILFPKSLTDLAAGDSPLGVAGVESLDEFVFEYWPGDGWSGNVSAWRYA